MRCLSVTLLATATAFALTQAASAADMPTKAPVYKAPVVAPAYNWTGFYVGGNIGYSWGRQDNSIGAVSLGTVNVDGVIGGGQVGYNWQMNQIVLGIEADIQGSGQKGDGTFIGPAALIPSSTYTFTDKLDWFGTVRGRAGYAIDRWLPYVTGGWAWGRGSVSASVSGGVTGTGSASHDYSGWTVGGGLEYAFLNNWSAKVEYLYIDFGNGPSATLAPSAAVLTGGKLTDNIARVGVNYKF